MSEMEREWEGTGKTPVIYTAVTTHDPLGGVWSAKPFRLTHVTWIPQVDHESALAERDAARAEAERLGSLLRNLVFMARTSGGTAGSDDALMAACERVEAALGEGEG